MSFQTKAENLADCVRDVDGFKEFSLIGVRDKVSDLLKMIGRIEGVFSTYSLHDISHVDAMLNMLDWLVPPETSKKMTSVEWLLIVLSLYLHDLGMVVTKEEYTNRNSNSKFKEFENRIDGDPNCRDYRDRLIKIPEMDRQYDVTPSLISWIYYS